jgi:proline iminopeptidase
MARRDISKRADRVRIGKHEVVTYHQGEGEEVLFLLNGGPGLPCDYLREPLLRMVDAGYQVITYDQLGCGASDKPPDKGLWTIGRYAGEVETVRNALGLGKVHLLGHSWGGWLGIEYAVTHPDALKSLVLSNTCGDMPHLVQELNRLREALGSETVAMMQRHEAEGTLEHEEYKAAITLLNYRHVLRLPEWPDPVKRSLADWNMDVYGTMQGPNEFLYTGNLKEWNRLAEMRNIAVPCLILVGQHDELPPSCAMRMHQAVPGSEIKVFPNSSHMPFYEEPEAYFATLTAFLNRASGKSGRGGRQQT